MSTTATTPATLDFGAIIRRTHARAKRLRLAVKNNQVYLTLPPRVSERMVNQFLQDATPWLQQHWPRDVQSALVDAQGIEGTSLHLPILQRQLTISIEATYSQALDVGEVLYLPSQATAAHLQHWVKYQAGLYLPSRLALLAKAYGFSYAGCTIRRTTTRWGSCSSRKTISLNAALMLLPSSQIDYVLLHELCHTVHMNHSAHFWQLMLQVCPNYMAERKAVKGFAMPVWWGQ